MTPFDGKSVLVTGAASGIGRATAHAFSSAGAHVLLADIVDLSSVRDEVANWDARVETFACDVSDPASVDALCAQIAASGSRIDIAVHCAGVLIEGSIVDMPVGDFDRQIAINLRGTFLIAQGTIRMMRQHGAGRLILIASELAHQGRSGASAYCASKAGVIGLTRALARECAPDILVNAVAPGPVDTPMLGLAEMPASKLSEETSNPLGRVGQPAEIAEAILYLAGSGATFMTGQTLCPSGGAVML